MNPIVDAIREVGKLYRTRLIRDAEDTISRALGCIVKATLDELHGIDDPDVTHLVHYTRLDVLFSLVDPSSSANGQKAGLRAYDTVHSNDPEEGMFLIRQWPPNTHWGWDIARIDDPTSEHGERIAASSPAYILSFVQSRITEPMNDKLTFWKEYGNGCKGCSLSIPVKQVVRQGRDMTPYRVVYGREKVEELFSYLDEQLLVPITAITENDDFTQDFRNAIGRTLRNTLQPFRYLYKDKTYAHEEECRIVITPHGVSPFRDDLIYEPKAGMNGATRLRHYPRQMLVNPAVLFHSDAEIRLGPLVPYKQNVLVVIEKLLRRYCDYAFEGDVTATPRHPPNVVHSEIHYREG